MRKEYNISLKQLMDDLVKTEVQPTFSFGMLPEIIGPNIRRIMFDTSDVCAIHDLQSPRSAQRVVEAGYVDEEQGVGRIVIAGKYQTIHNGDIVLWSDGITSVGHLVFDVAETPISYEMHCILVVPEKKGVYDVNFASHHYQVRCVEATRKAHEVQKAARNPRLSR